MELSSLYDKLKGIKGGSFKAEIGFDLKKVLRRIMHFNPGCILIDDNLGKSQLKKLMKRLTTNRKTRDIPITILKNSNTGYSVENAQDFLLKDAVTADILRSSIINSMKLKRMQVYLTKTYRKSKTEFLDKLWK